MTIIIYADGTSVEVEDGYVHVHTDGQLSHDATQGILNDLELLKEVNLNE